MPVLFHDFETRSTLDLEDVGAWRYACDPTTEALCCAYAADDGPIQLWTPADPVPPEFVEAARNPAWVSSAFNDHFERLITQHIMAPRHGWPLIPLARRRCSQAATLALALPAKLKVVAQVLNLDHQKDEAGRNVMLRLTRGKNPRAGDLEKLYAYCKQDVAVERALHHCIAALSPNEQVLWALDAMINARGIHIDGALLDAAIKIAEAAVNKINTELRTTTEGAVETVHQTARLISWLAGQDCSVTDVQKGTLKRALTRENLSPAVRRVMELRLDGAHAAVAKLRTMRAWRNGDGRARGVFRFHGASTGRWTSFGIQLQNLKRPLTKDMDQAIEAVSTGDLEHLRQRYPQPMSVVGDITRALICAAGGHRLIAADFSGIESRVTAWISGQQSKLNQWAKFDRTGDPKDEPYFILGKQVGQQDETARIIGKTADLAFGYMGGVGAWKKLAPEDDTATDAEIKQRQQAWRRAHAQTVKFWGRMNRAAIQTVRKPGSVMKCGRVTFACDDTFLYMQLPSGRMLAYPFPKLKTAERGDLAVVFMDNAGGKWTECRHGHGAYGGTWIENAVQAVARDLFAAAMPRLEAAGYPIVLHVHDEIVAEVPDGFGSEEEFLRILTTAPAWADGLPIAAKVRTGPRFCKLNKPKAIADAPSRPAEPAMTQLAATNAAPAPKILQQNSRNAPPRETAFDMFETPPQPGNGSVLPHVNDASYTAPPAAPYMSRATPGNGARAIDGSKAEAERDTYAEDHADKPFSDAHLRRQGYRLAHVFDYSLADGMLLYQHNRYELQPGIAPIEKKPRKRFLSHRSVNGKDVLGAGNRRVIFNWLAIMRAEPGSTVFVTEGELKAKVLIDAGLLATTVLSHKWTPECVAALTGHHVIILADHDKDGDRYAADAQRHLAPVAASTRIVTATHLWKYLPGGKEPKLHNDVKDWIELGGDPTKLLDICRKIPADGSAILESVCAADVEIEDYDWIWPGRFALKKIGLIVGLPDEGKGLALSDIIARISRGSPWPCNEGIAPLGNVILLSAEDDIADTITPRLIAAGADLARVEILKMMHEAGNERMFSLITDLHALQQKVIEIGDVKMIVIDPISAYLGIGKVDSYRATDVRAVLGPLKEFAEKHRVSIIGIMHFNKKIDITNVLLRISDSLAYGAASRHVYGVISDPGNFRRLFVRGKNNIAKDEQNTLAFSFDEREVGIDKRTGNPIRRPYIMWHPEPVDITATEALQAAAESKSPTARDDAKHFLEALLSNGPVSAAEVLETAKVSGISARTLRRAQKDLGVNVEKDGPLNDKSERTWQWHLTTG
jgi:DNA polymerase